MPIVFALLYVLCHGMAITVFRQSAMAVSFVFLIAAPLLAAGMCVLRCREAGFHPTRGWSALALGMLLWAGGMALNMQQEIFLDNLNSTPGGSMLLYILYGVPLIFAIASTGEPFRDIYIIDAVFAAVLGYLYFVHTFSVSTVHDTSTEGVNSLRLMLDLENIFIALFAVIRYAASVKARERPFFRALSVYAFVYLMVAVYINHVQPDNVDFGGLSDVLIDVPFLTLLVLASASAGSPPAPSISRRLALFVQAGTPLVMPVALLIVAGFVMSSHFALGMTGAAMAVVGYGMRSTLVQVRAYEARDQSNDLARIDVLTGVPNRRQFDEYLAQEWRRAKRSGSELALLLIDVDDFKLLNDTHGHQKGDDCLRVVAGTLNDCVPVASGLVARYGGEEFAALLPSTSLDAAFAVAERMRATVEKIHLYAAVPFGHVTVSIGVAVFSGSPNADIETLIATADEALYRAKHGGKNQVDGRLMGGGA